MTEQQALERAREIISTWHLRGGAVLTESALDWIEKAIAAAILAESERADEAQRECIQRATGIVRGRMLAPHSATHSGALGKKP